MEFVGLPGWGAWGVGMARVIPVAEPNGTVYYSVFEAWNLGVSCGSSNSPGNITMGIASSTQPDGPWIVNPTPIRDTAFQPNNCGAGSDMPSIQYLPGAAHPFRIMVPDGNIPADTWRLRQYIVTTT